MVASGSLVQRLDHCAQASKLPILDNWLPAIKTAPTAAAAAISHFAASRIDLFAAANGLVPDSVITSSAPVGASTCPKAPPIIEFQVEVMDVPARAEALG